VHYWMEQHSPQVQASLPVPATISAPAQPARHAAPQSGELLALRLDLATPRKLTVDIYGPDARIVRNYPAQAYDAGSHKISWDGRDNLGALVGPGRYRVEVRYGSRKLVKFLEIQPSNP
jgi:hypothetical protein